MLHQITWCESRVARADVSIAAKVTHVTFHAESIDRLVRQACQLHLRQVGEASQLGGDAIGHRQRCFDQRAKLQVVEVCKTAFKRCFDQIAQNSIDVLVVNIMMLEKARQHPSLQAAKAIEADKMPAKAKLAKLSKTEPAKAFAKAYALAEVQLN